MMGTSWTKRHAPQITGKNGDMIDRSEGQKRYWERYDKWKEQCMEGRPGRRRWKKWPLKWGDCWNPRLECWWSEIRSGIRHPEGHEEQGELTDKGKELHGLKEKSFNPVKKVQEVKQEDEPKPSMPMLRAIPRATTKGEEE